MAINVVDDNSKFIDFIKYVEFLKFDQTPDYRYLQCLFDSTINTSR